MVTECCLLPPNNTLERLSMAHFIKGGFKIAMVRILELKFALVAEAWSGDLKAEILFSSK